jgi:hypothetical protein
MAHQNETPPEGGETRPSGTTKITMVEICNVSRTRAGRILLHIPNVITLDLKAEFAAKVAAAIYEKVSEVSAARKSN